MRIAITLGCIATALSCLLLASAAGAKDLIVQQRSSGLGGTTPREETVYLAGDKIVRDSPAARTIVDLAAKTITAADKAKRTYSVVTFDELHAQMKALRENIKKLAPDVQAQFGTLFDDDVKVTVVPTGKTAKIAGHAAKEYSVNGGPYSGSVWFTDEIATPSEFKRWNLIEQEGGGASQRLGEALDKIDGFPLRTRLDVHGPKQSSQLTNEVLEIRDGSPAPDVVVVPPGFTKQTEPAKPAGG